MKEWFGGKNFTLTELIYKGTRDGFSSQNFHSKVDGRGAIIVIIKSNIGGNIFGGYTKKGFNSCANYSTDPDAFLFSVTKKTKIIQNANNTYSLYDEASRHATWGGGHDLGLMTNCNTENTSYCNLGHTYVPPDGHANGSEGAKNYLAGAYNFMTEEIEIF